MGEACPVMIYKRNELPTYYWEPPPAEVTSRGTRRAIYAWSMAELGRGARVVWPELVGDRRREDLEQQSVVVRHRFVRHWLCVAVGPATVHPLLDVARGDVFH